jgi:hypothetical protein
MQHAVVLHDVKIPHELTLALHEGGFVTQNWPPVIPAFDTHVKHSESVCARAPTTTRASTDAKKAAFIFLVGQCGIFGLFFQFSIFNFNCDL